MDLDTGAAPKQALSIHELRKSYGAVEVLKSISISMNAGDFLVLIGPSGCGKSTLLNCIAGLEETTSGVIEIDGRDVTRVPPRDRDIAMVFQSYALYPTMSVRDNIGFGMKIRKLGKDQIDERVGQVADVLQIGHLLDRRPGQLSGGQRQRVAMGRALVRNPVLFLFDEPLSNLDAKLRVEMRAEIKRLHQTTGTSIVYVTHDQIEAMTLATRIVVLHDGVVQQVGTPEDIYDRPANIFVADFMGSPPMNLIPAETGANGRLVLDGGQTLDIGARSEPPHPQVGVIVGIRPEHMSFVGQAGTGIAVTPNLIEHTGSDTYVSFVLGETKATARMQGKFEGEIGKEVELFTDTQQIVLFDKANGKRL
jgi:multiple sugar transport system ATP-binding protein